MVNEKAGVNRPFIWLLLIPLGILTFYNLSMAGFVGDDYDQVLYNPVITSLKNPYKFFSGSTFNSGGAEELRGTYYKPAMTAVFALNYQVFGPSPLAFHCVQVVIGILNSIFLFFLLRTLFTPVLSLIGSAVFLIHPANSEAIQYISNYQDALFMFFGLLALGVEAYRKSSAIYWILLEFGLLLLSGLSKETGLLFIPLFITYAWCLRGEWRLWPPILAAFVYIWLRIFVSNVGGVQAHYTPMETADTLIRLMNVPAAVFYYIKSFFFPWPLGLAQHWMYREVTFTGFFLPILGIVAAKIFAYFSIRRFGKPAVLFTIWSVLAFGLHSQLIALDATVADRWHYMMSIGMLGLLLLWLEHFWPHVQRSIIVAGAFLFATLVFWTHQRNSHWRNEETLLRRDLKYQPESFAIMSQLGFLLLNQNRYDEACPLLEKSVAIAPKWWVNTNNYGVCLFAANRAEEALRMFQLSIDNGRYYLAYENYAKVLINQKRFGEAKRFLDQVAEQFPGNAALRGLMATVRDALN